jgi:hypothetical protein
MQFRPKHSERGVAPIIGIAIAMTLVSLLAGVVAVVVLAAEGTTGDSGPDMEFTSEYDSDAGATTEDSFDNTGDSYDGLLTIRYTGGDVVQAEQLLVAGAGAEPGRTAFSAAAEYNVTETVDSGDAITVWVDSTDSVGIVWNHLETEQSATVDSWDGPDN